MIRSQAGWRGLGTLAGISYDTTIPMGGAAARDVLIMEVPRKRGPLHHAVCRYIHNLDLARFSQSSRNLRPSLLAPVIAQYSSRPRGAASCGSPLRVDGAAVP